VSGDRAAAIAENLLSGRSEPNSSVIVIGVGNEFRRDDGAGPRVLELLDDLPGVQLAGCDGEPARLIGLWEGADLAVVVDAVRGDRPGRIHELDLDTVAQARRGNASSHALGLDAAVELAQAVDRMPARLVILAVEGTDFGVGLGMTAPVAAALPELAACITRVARGRRVKREPSGVAPGGLDHESHSGPT
jgi:hydrogenase maturation protease